MVVIGSKPVAMTVIVAVEMSEVEEVVVITVMSVVMF